MDISGGVSKQLAHSKVRGLDLLPGKHSGREPTPALLLHDSWFLLMMDLFSSL